MYTGKKRTKEDTWRPEELIKHIQSPEEERQRRERSHRDRERERRKHREESSDDRRGEVTDEREKESRREQERARGTEYRDREKDRQRESYKAKEKERHRDGLGERDREREREREKERDEEKDLEREKRYRQKDRDRNKEKDRETDKEREKRDRERDRDREKKDREKEREKEKRDRERDVVREKRDREKHRLREKEIDRPREEVRDRRGERDRDRDRERLRERKRSARESDRRHEKDVVLDEDKSFREREKDKKERHRARKNRQEEELGGGEEQRKERRERERREKHGQTDGEERREGRRREKEQHDVLEKEQRHRQHEDGDGVREDTSKRREDELDDSNQRFRQHQSELRKNEHEAETEDKQADTKDYGNEEDHYEDDFEAYEEDFEDFDEDEEEEEKEEEEKEEEVRENKSTEAERELSPHSRREVEAVRRAMEEENELVGTASSTTQEAGVSHRASADSGKSRTYGRVIDFVAARQREINQQAANKQKMRSAELLRLIDLDFSVTECFLDLPPVPEYDLYIKRYGMANTKQVYVQCNEDNVERDTQTEETEITDKWTQHPPETAVACGGPRISQNASEKSMSGMMADSRRLAAFLRSATQVMSVLLEENIAESNSVKKLQSQTHTYSFSDGCVQLNTELSFLRGRQVTLLHFSKTQTHTLLSVHAPRSDLSTVTLDSNTLMCVWNIWEPSSPQRILVCEAEVRGCCFSPGKATLVFAGTSVGSVLLWDLREHTSFHTHIRVHEEEWTLHQPTYSTNAVLSGVEYFSPIVSVEPVPVNLGAGHRDTLLRDRDESLGLSFLLSSLDEHGLLNLWVVVELSKADDSGSQTDLGLCPGGKVKLLHSSSLQTTPRMDMGATAHLSFVLKFLPSDSNHYFIGSNRGLVRHGMRHGLQAVPKLYRPKDRERPTEVTTLECCPNGEPFFLVGCSDGSVRLHTLVCEEAVCEWVVGSGHAAVQCVQFSPTRCSVFCALDSTSVLHIWDLTQSLDSPLHTQDLHADPISAMAMSGDAVKQNPYSGIALAKDSGMIEILFLLPSLTLPQASDTEKLHSLAHDTS